jgi:hypothetical protein
MPNPWLGVETPPLPLCTQPRVAYCFKLAGGGKASHINDFPISRVKSRATGLRLRFFWMLA